MPSTTKTRIEDLTQEEIRIFLKSVKKTHFYKRIQFIRYKKEGLTHEKIAVLLGVCLKTLTNWMARFSRTGMEGLVDVSYDRRDSKLCPIEEVLRKKVSKGEISTGAACRDWLKEEQKISVSLSTTLWFLKKNGVVLQKDQARTRRDA